MSTDVLVRDLALDAMGSNLTVTWFVGNQFRYQEVLNLFRFVGVPRNVRIVGYEGPRTLNIPHSDIVIMDGLNITVHELQELEMVASGRRPIILKF